MDARRVLANVSAGLFGTEADAVRVGRFSVLERVGAGAMGTVYAAYDPQLDRKVAIKVLHGELDETPERAQLLREARALARLDHANVATVYEVGTVDRRLFMAMEFVDGEPLERWITETHDWREVVRVFAEAGAGLEAAHIARLVHRDFKPGNVMLRRDGRVIVLDFGLARAADAFHESEAGAHGSSLEAVTKTGAVVGTPAYMAPEQHQGEPATAQSDQFAFCVSLFEALYGQRPFAGETRSAVLDAIERGAIEVPSGRDVPRRCLVALTRGLKPDPQDRWPDMKTLIATLTDDPVGRWRRRGLVPVVALAAVAVTWSLGQSPASEREDPCASATAAIDSLWNDEARGAIEVALRGTGLPSTDFVLPRLLSGLDRYADTFRHEVVALCHDEHDPSALPGIAGRERCLQSRLVDFEATVGVLRTPSDNLAPNVLYTLPSAADVAGCASFDPPAPAAENDPNHRTDLSSARAVVLARAEAADESMEAAEQALDAARQSGDQRSISRALASKGRALSSLGRVVEAEPLLFEAVLIAERIDDLEGKLDALDALGMALIETSKIEEADRIVQLAVAAHERLGVRAPSWTVAIEMLQGNLEEAREDLDAASRHYERARQAAEHPDALVVDRLIVALAATRPALLRQQFREAIPALRHAVALTEDLLGPVHEGRAAALNNLGAAYYFTANVGAAEAAYREAIRVRRALEGPDAPGAAGPLMGLAGVVMNDDPEEAVAVFGEALAAYSRARGPESRMAAATRLNTGIALRRLDRNDEAREAFEHAERTLEDLGANPSSLLRASMHLVELDVDAGNCADAEARDAKASSSADAADPTLRSSTIRLRVAIARCRPRASERIVLLEQALALCEEHGADGYPRAKAAVALAEELMDSDVDRVRELLLMAHGDIPVRSGVHPAFVEHLDALSESVDLERYATR